MKSFRFIYLSFITSIIFISCQKEYSLELGNPTTPAKGSLQDTLGNCLPDSVYGTFYNGVTPGDTNYVQIEVNVTTAGSYSIKTDIQNGLQFADSGFFNTTGINIVKLKTLGTAILPTITDFIVSFDSSVCSFSVNVKDSTGTGLGGTGGGGIDSAYLSDTAWHFSDSTNNYHGTIDTAFTKDSMGVKALVLNGSTSATGDTIFTIGVLLPTGTITPGTYLSNITGGFEFQDGLTGASIYSADPFVTGGALVTIIITNYDSVTNIVTGTFSGTAQSASGNTTITNGGFTAKVM